jgi:Na+/H+ antiporter NhaA
MSPNPAATGCLILLPAFVLYFLVKSGRLPQQWSVSVSVLVAAAFGAFAVHRATQHNWINLVVDSLLAILFLAFAYRKHRALKQATKPAQPPTDPPQ